MRKRWLTLAFSKNASGSKPCPCCINWLGHCQPFEHEYFVHYTSADVHRFGLHTPDTFAEAVQDVKLAAATGNKGLLGKAEQEHGIVFEPDSVVFDGEMSKQANLPDCLRWDTMHNVCAIGGFGQYEVNRFCRELQVTILHARL